MIARIPANEAARLAKLRSYDVLDSLPELLYEEITALASSICGTPISAISLIDENRQWFKSIKGLDVSETSRDVAFCAHAILDSNEVMVVPNALEDDRFSENPLVTNAPSIRFYAGAPLVTSDNFAIGTLCVIDSKANSITDEQRDALQILANQVVSQLELRKKIREIEEEKILRAAADESLRMSEMQLKAAIKGARLGVWDWNISTGEVIFNEQWAEMLGYALDELDPHVSTWERLVHPEDLPGIQLVLNEHLEGKTRQYRVDQRLLSKSGEWFWVHASGAVMERGPDGQALRIIGIHEDINARKVAEEQLSESEIRLKAALSGAQLGVWDWNVATGSVKFDERWAEMLGYRVEEIEPNVSSWEKLVHPDDMPGVMETLTDHLKGRTPIYRTEHRMRSKSGDWVWVLDGGRVMSRDEDGKPLRAVGVHEDITARKMVEVRLKESEARLAEAQRVAGVGSWEYDIESGHITWSAETYRITGRDPKLGPPNFDENLALYTPQSAEMIANAASLAVREGTPYSFDLALGPKAPCAYVHAIGNAVTDDDGRVVRLVGTLMDISERHTLEEKLAARERFLDKLSQTIPDCVMVYDLRERKFLFENHDLFEALGHEPNGAEYRDPFEQLVHPSDRAHVEANWARIGSIPEGGAVQIECRLLRGDGEWCYYQTRITTFLRDENGVPTQTLALARDVSQNKELEAQIVEQMMFANEANLKLHTRSHELHVANEALETANIQLEALATTDGLTGLKNHRTFQEFLEQEYQQSKRYGTPLSLILLDVDHFKKFNDSYGHQAGDETLKKVAACLQEVGRVGDMVARYGGEEFVLGLPQTDKEDALVVAERVRLSIESQEWPHRSVTVSSGVASYTPLTASRAEMISLSDQALYLSKERGRNRVTHAYELQAAALKTA